MRRLIAILTIILTAMTLAGYWYVLPESRADAVIITSFYDASESAAGKTFESDFRAWCIAHHDLVFRTGLKNGIPPFKSLRLLDPADPRREPVDNLMRQWFRSTHAGKRLISTPQLVWSTDDNQTRRNQMRLFRSWYLENFSEPIDIVTDPSNRDVTKMVVQSIGGTGADIIESYGPQQFRALVESGIALDLTAQAKAHNFDYHRCFEAAWSSFVSNGRQYGFPANVGYVVLLYHKDLFRQAGVQPPPDGTAWNIDQLVAAAKKLTVQSPTIPGGRRWGIVGMNPWPMALSNGGRFFNDTGTRCIYNSRETVEAFQAYQNLIYRYHVMPSPAQTASMAAAGGFTGGGNNGLYFAARLCAMSIDGRWGYSTYAQANYHRVIRPALERRAKLVSTSRTDQERIGRIVTALDQDILTPLAHEDLQFLRDSLTDADRAQLLQIGVMHLPTVHGNIQYSDVGARVGLVNRRSRHVKEATRFIEFLASKEYNDQINATFDSICGVREYCTDRDGISGPPDPSPGLEDMDSPVFVQAMKDARSQQLSPFIGPDRQGFLAGQVMDRLTDDTIDPARAARLIEARINEQMQADIARDPDLQQKWKQLTGKKWTPDP